MTVGYESLSHCRNLRRRRGNEVNLVRPGILSWLRNPIVSPIAHHEIMETHESWSFMVLDTVGFRYRVIHVTEIPFKPILTKEKNYRVLTLFPLTADFPFCPGPLERSSTVDTSNIKIVKGITRDHPRKKAQRLSMRPYPMLSLCLSSAEFLHSKTIFGIFCRKHYRPTNRRTHPLIKMNERF